MPHPNAGFLLCPCVELWVDFQMRTKGERSDNHLLEGLWAPSCGWTMSTCETFVLGWGVVILILVKRQLRMGGVLKLLPVTPEARSPFTEA